MPKRIENTIVRLKIRAYRSMQLLVDTDFFFAGIFFRDLWGWLNKEMEFLVDFFVLFFQLFPLDKAF